MRFVGEECLNMFNLAGRDCFGVFSIISLFRREAVSGCGGRKGSFSQGEGDGGVWGRSGGCGGEILRGDA